MTEPTVNIPLLRKAVEWAEAEAAKPWELREWDQEAYRVLPSEFEAEYRNEVAQKSPECGTCYCIAGFVASQTMPEYNEWSMSSAAHDIAAEALGLREAAAYALFRSDNAIEDVRRIAESIAGERL